MSEATATAGRRGGGKSAAAYRTISEVSEELSVPQHVLRFWETKFSQVRPLKRGGGRRYYRPEDIDLLRQIQHLLYEEGFTIRGVQKLLKEGQVKPGQPLPTVTPTAPEDRDESASGPAATAPATTDGGRHGALPADVRQQLADVLRELKALRAALTSD
ncbi:MAG: MerR family transcriptional regulator [Azospirillaceae bacterium]